MSSQLFQEEKPSSTRPPEPQDIHNDANGANGANSTLPAKPSPAKDIRFWLIMVGLILSVFISAIDGSGLSTALPTIVREFDLGADYLDRIDKYRTAKRLVRRLDALGYAVLLRPKPTD